MRTLTAVVILAALGAILVPVAATAQSAIRANIPFEFSVGGVTLPAGNYQFDNQPTPRALLVWGLDQKASAQVLGSPAYARPRAQVASRVVFNKYGNRHFLTEVWNETNAMGTRVTKSREEREASLKASAQTVLVAAQ